MKGLSDWCVGDAGVENWPCFNFCKGINLGTEPKALMGRGQWPKKFLGMGPIGFSFLPYIFLKKKFNLLFFY
jgi:hypothetical protein